MAITDETLACFGPQARPFLFGSRTDDHRCGGDIDLLVRTESRLPDAWRRKVEFLVHLKSRMGDQRIDVVVAGPDDERDIVRIAEAQAVPLVE